MEFIKLIIGFLDGKKTYLVAIGVIFQTFYPFFHGDVTLGDTLSGENLKAILEGLGLFTLRLGIAKK